MSALRRRRRYGSEGFTLVELMVAATAGLVVAAAAFILSKNAMTVFQQEARISTAQLGAQLGMTRLTADIMRAGFMASPNLPSLNNSDRCGDSPAVFDNGDVFRFQAVRIYQAGSDEGACCDGASAPQSIDPANDLYPDAIDLVGNFHSAEMFPVAAIDPTGTIIHLQIRNGPMYRTLKDLLGNPASATSDYDNLIGEIFHAGRMLRVIDDVGKEAYGVIVSANVFGGTGSNPPDQIVINLDPAVPLPQRSVEGTCGLSGFGTGLVVNPVARMRYELRSLAGDADYGNLVAADPATIEITGDGGRVELVRVEKAIDNTDISIELVSEYATDLQFGVSAACELPSGPCTTPTDEPVMQRLQPEGPRDADIAAVPPERMRSVHVRFSTRTRAPDQAVSSGVAGPDGRPQSFFIPGVPGSLNKYARMRTLYAEIALPNLFGVTW